MVCRTESLHGYAFKGQGIQLGLKKHRRSLGHEMRSNDLSAQI